MGDILDTLLSPDLSSPNTSTQLSATTVLLAYAGAADLTPGEQPFELCRPHLNLSAQVVLPEGKKKA
jgi:hypothetical protein